MSGFPWLTAVVVLPVAGAMVLQVIPGKASGPIKAVTAVFAAAEASPQPAWSLLFYALWHSRHVLGGDPGGDIAEVLAAAR